MSSAYLNMKITKIKATSYSNLSVIYIVLKKLGKKSTKVFKIMQKKKEIIS